MNGMNRTIVGVVSAIALLYSGLCFILTLIAFFDSADYSIHIIVFLPHGASVSAMGIDITQAILNAAPDFKFTYGGMISSLMNLIGISGGEFYIGLLMLIAGFFIAAFGFVTKPSLDVVGRTNPAEYLWTHRPNAFLRCLAMPWGLILACWAKHKIPVVIPILLLFMYWPWAIIMMLATIIPFIIVRASVSSKIAAAAKKESKEYQQNTSFGVCPHCKRSFDRPMVKCRCGLILDYPVPNIYGYRYHTCNKGHNISCESGKRSNLDTICPHCNQLIQTKEALPITVSFVGGTNTGKTSLMLAAVETITKSARMVDISVDSPSPDLSKKALAAKDYVPRTVPGELESQIIFLRSMKLQDREIIFNDISGVEFQPSVNKVMFEEYYNYTNGIIFTFDPMSFKRDLKREAPHEVFECFHYMFTTIRNVGPGTVSDIPFAVVATKSDISSPKLNDEDVRNYLIENGEENFVRVVESLFSDVQYFSVCSHGVNCSSAMRPVWWIVQHVDPKLTEIIPSP